MGLAVEEIIRGLERADNDGGSEGDIQVEKFA